MYKLYFSPGAASLVVHWLLIELDMPYALLKLDMVAKEHKAPTYLALNPNGVVPTLLCDDKPLYEAAALVMYLVDSKPKADLAPAVGSFERGQYYQWMFHLANTLQPPFRAWWYPAEAAGEANSAAAKEAARIKIESVFNNLDTHLAVNGPHLLGEKLSAVDFMLVMLMRWSRGMPKTALDYPHLAHLAGLLKARPSWKTLYAEEGLEEWA
jgi:glutathione S-transferase